MDGFFAVARWLYYDRGRALKDLKRLQRVYLNPQLNPIHPLIH